MRIFFLHTPAHGPLLPELPPARAFPDRGDKVAAITSAGFGPQLAAEHITFLPAAPEMPELFVEAARLAGAGDPTVPSVAELFAGARIDLTADEAIAVAREFRRTTLVASVRPVMPEARPWLSGTASSWSAPTRRPPLRPGHPSRRRRPGAANSDALRRPLVRTPFRPGA